MNKTKAQYREFKVANWRHAVGLVCLAALPGAISQAYAFGLGHATVKSALGQPLHADIDITQITPNEASSLKVGIAPASAFQSRKLNYSSILPDLTVTLEHRPDGTPYLRLTSSRPVQEPFVDVLLRAYWANGELTRDYTLLFDPPSFQEPQAATQIAPQAPAQQAPLAQQTPSAGQESKRQTAPPTPAPPRPAARPSQPSAASTYTVHQGDTLSSIAQRFGVEGASLDQMLTALYRANSGAFIDSNMNLLRSGAILRIPGAQEVQAIPQSQAHQVVVVQSHDFEAYRRRLAEMTSQAAPQEQTNARKATGKVQAEVQEPAAGASGAQSQLKLSKATVGAAAQKQAEQASEIAKQKQAESTAHQLAETKANVAALSKLAASASAAVRAATSGPAMTGSAAAPAPVGASSSSAQAAVAKPAASATPSAIALPAAAPASKPKPAVKPTLVTNKPAVSASPGMGWLSGLLANPLFAPAAGAIVLLLAALAFMRRRQHSKPARDTSVFDSRLSAADSFFGGTGGERVDTRNSTLGSSVAYSPSQLDTGDVDPVAEADVYLAYGRDLQAEEILKESLKNHPDRNAARLKLLEIYAKRKDVRSFEMTAAELFALTEGVGDDWKKAQDLGRNLDPVNPLYHNTVPPSTINAPTTIPATDFAPTGSSLMAAPATVPATELLTSLPSLMTASAATKAEEPGSRLDLNLNLSAPEAAAAKGSQPSAPSGGAGSDQPDSALNFDMSGFPPPSPTPPAASPSKPGEPPSAQPLEFDLGALSLDLPGEPSAFRAPAVEVSAPQAASQPQAKPGASQGLDTRLALVEECRAMGDLDMARNLLGEIIAESDGATKERAEKMLSELA